VSWVPDLVSCASRRFPDKVAVDVDGDTLTFAELSDRASLLAGWLRASGVGPGRRVALLAKNDREYLEIRVGSQRAGTILVPLNYRLSPAELQMTIEDAEVDVLLVGREMEGPAGSLEAPRRLHLGDGSYAQALAGAEPVPVPAGYAPEVINQLCYTSGTTGRPKGVMLSNGAVHSSTVAMGHEIGANPDAVFLACTPMFHVGSQVGSSCTFLGATQVQMDRFDVSGFLAALERTKPTHTQIVPTMLQLLMDAWGDRPPPSLQCILYGAAPMPPALLARLTEAWNCDFVNGYGSTEAMGISFLTPHEHRQVERLSVGRSSTVVSSRVTDDTGREIPANEVGEVRARGATLMSGYWRRPQETDEAIADGWLRTGDLGYRDGDGFLHLVDRRNDKIISGGENVFPSEVEDAIAVHPDVAEAAVIGVPDLKWGEAVVASVVLRGEAIVDEQGLKAHCREMLAPYKVPKVIRISGDPLPRTTTGKLLRREVRAAWSS